jgi:hypothetical protein
MSTHQITLQLDEDAYRELELAARDRGEDVVQTAQRALEEYLRTYMFDVEAREGTAQA